MKKFAMYYQNKLVRHTDGKFGIETILVELMSLMLIGETKWYFDCNTGINWQIIREL